MAETGRSPFTLKTVPAHPPDDVRETGTGAEPKMSYIQLIEKAVLPTSLWLTFWDLDEKSQLSLEVAAATDTYEVGRVFSLDRDANFERLALKPITAPTDLDHLDLLIPLPTGTAATRHVVGQRAVSIREVSGGMSRDHVGLLSFLG